MNDDAELKLQAYLDGELPAREAAEIKAWLDRDAEAQALLTELRNTQAALTGHEVSVKLPETREFYWSKIQGEIERQGRTASHAPGASLATWLWRSLVPAGTLAFVCALILRSGSSQAAPEFTPEMELASDDVGAATFRSQETGLTSVWFYQRDRSSESTPSVPADDLPTQSP
jgi:anti-sigma factor RsiW